MNFLSVLSYSLSGLSFLFSAVSAQENTLLETKADFVGTKWQGVLFQIPSVTRFDADTVLLEVRVSSNASLLKPTLIGFPNSKGMIIGGKTIYKPLAFSLSSAILTDRLTKATFSAVPMPLNQPSYGPSETITSIGRGSWFQMSVEFKLPVPAPNPDGTIPVQKVDITLPQANAPVVDVIIPPLKAKKP